MEQHGRDRHLRRKRRLLELTPPNGDRWGPGTRIPALVISPYAKKGYVDYQVFNTRFDGHTRARGRAAMKETKPQAIVSAEGSDQGEEASPEEIAKAQARAAHKARMTVDGGMSSIQIMHMFGAPLAC